METRSSTSSSSLARSFPTAGLLAAIVVLLLDAVALGIRGPWTRLQAAVPYMSFLEWGVVNDRRALRGLHDDSSDRPRVVLLGSSRAREGLFVPGGASAVVHGIRYAKVAHAGIGPFEIRSAVEEVLSYEPSVVVWLLSEFDTHQPLYLRPQASFGSLAAVRDLVAETGLGFAHEQRQVLYRLGLTAVLNSYRYRDVLGRAYLDDARRFDIGRLEPPSRREAPAIAGAPPLALPDGKLEEVLRSVRTPFPDGAPTPQAHQIRSITRGRHARVQMGLLTRAAQALHAAGVALIIMEGPLHPQAAALYDMSIREDFLAFSRALVREAGARFVSLEQAGQFGAADFADLTHLNGRGALKLTRAMRTAVRDVVGGD